MLRIGPVDEPVRLIWLGWIWAAVTAAYVIAFVAYMAIDPRLRPTYRAELLPGAAVANEPAARFRQETGQPVAYVIGPMYLGGNVGHYAAEAPRDVGRKRSDPRTRRLSRTDRRRSSAATVAVFRDPGAMGIHVDWTIVPPKPDGE